jgi:hypothetical protein
VTHQGEKVFLSARRSYLTEEQRITFGIAQQAPVNNEAQTPEDTSSETSEKVSGRKARKA